MTHNPLYNALLAIGYIALVVSVLFFGSAIAGEPDNILMPMGMLAVFVLSAAMMAFIFFYRPVIMLLDGKRDEAVKLFLTTVAYFAGFTILVVAASILISAFA